MRKNKYALQFAILFLAFLAALQIGFSLFINPAIVSPAAGVAFAGLVILDISLWPAIFLAGILSFTINGFPFIPLLLLPLAYTLTSLLGAYLLRRFNFGYTLGHVRDMMAFLGTTLLISFIIPTVGYGAWYLEYAVLGTPLPIFSWMHWWVGILISLLIVALAIIRFSSKKVLQFDRPIEIWAVLTIFIIGNVFFWWTDEFRYLDTFLGYLGLFLMMWMALRLGSRVTAFGMLSLTVLALLGTIFGVHQNISDMGGMLYGIEILVISLSVIFFIIVSLGQDRRTALGHLKEQVDQLEKALKRIRMEDEAKSNFISVLAHELRNPLAPIMSSVELLQMKKTKSKEEHEAYELIQSRAKTISRLLDDLLDVGRISKQKLLLQKESVDIREIISLSVRSMASRAVKKNIQIITTLPSEPLQTIGDPIRIGQIFENLLDNAIKFTEPGGKVFMSAEKESGSARINIRDNGIGIEKPELERIFQPFLQTASENHYREGLGIGLALTKNLVEMHDGNIAAKSEGRGTGTEFTVSLPLFSLGTSSLALPAPKEEKSSQKKLKGNVENQKIGKSILIVDDNTAAADTTAKLLHRKAGFETMSVYTAAEAKEKAAQFGPDVILLDIGLPDMNGHDLAKIIREELHFTGTLIALTGYGQEEDRRSSEKSGFDYHLTKPVDTNELIKLCNKA